MVAMIQVKDLKKRYGSKIVFEKLNLQAPKGKITALFGPNGTGKSTLFEIIAGLEKKDGGTVSIGNYNKHFFSYVPQNYRETLLPWRTNFANIALPLHIQHIPEAVIQTKIQQFLKDFNISVDIDAYPYQLSGGQQQIITLLRAFVTKPKLLLLDEPFSAFDYENSIKWRNILQRYFLQTKSTIFVITHDIEEAVYLASEIIVLSKKPAQIISQIQNPLPYPRLPEFLRLKRFTDISYKTLQAFQSSL